MGAINIKLDGGDLSKLNNKIKELKRFSEQKFNNEIGTTAADIISKATNRVPVDTGNLKQSLSFGKGSKDSWFVQALAKYAPYIEFGTGGSINTADAQKLGINSAMIKSMFGGDGKRKVNMKPQPYFFNSIREGFNALLIRLNKDIKKIL